MSFTTTQPPETVPSAGSRSATEAADGVAVDWTSETLRMDLRLWSQAVNPRLMCPGPGSRHMLAACSPRC